jgi:hypothetical protein
VGLGFGVFRAEEGRNQKNQNKNFQKNFFEISLVNFLGS